jgi:hypothetical protein
VLGGNSTGDTLHNLVGYDPAGQSVRHYQIVQHSSDKYSSKAFAGFLWERQCNVGS